MTPAIPECDDLRRERDRYRALAEMTSDWLWEVDAEGRYTYCSPRCRELLGYEPDELLGKTPFDLMPPDEAIRVRAEFTAIMAERRAFADLINVNRHRQGEEVVLETSGVPLLGPAGELLGYRGVDRDVTKRHRAYLELKDLARQLERERDRAEMANTAKASFLSLMSHELRTPLNAIIGFSEMLQQEVLGPLGHAQYRGFAEDIRKSGTHLLAIVNDILEHARLEAGGVRLEESPIPIEGLLHSIARMLRPLAQLRDVGIVVDVPEDFPLLLCDERRLHQAIVNLGVNAVRFSDPGMRVLMAASLLPDGTPAIHVEDHGQGMDPEGVVLAVTPFGQVRSGLDRTTNGTGLGLPIAIRLVELHGGTLSIDSARGKGTTVTVALPGRAMCPAP